jgi:hydrogenase maturation protease
MMDHTTNQDFPSLPRTLVLALGNDILGDDAVGFLAARELRAEFGEMADVVESGEAGLALIELMEGYDRAILLDAAMTGRYDPGTVIEFKPCEFSRLTAPSPHYAGLPEVLDLARRLELRFPTEIVILALEVVDPFTIRESLTPVVEAALPEYIRRAREVLAAWTTTPAATTAG